MLFTPTTHTYFFFIGEELEKDFFEYMDFGAMLYIARKVREKNSRFFISF